MDKWFDEATGLWNIGKRPGGKEFWVVSKKPGPMGLPVGFGFCNTLAQAKRLQLSQGIRATSKIIEV